MLSASTDDSSVNKKAMPLMTKGNYGLYVHRTMQLKKSREKLKTEEPRKAQEGLSSHGGVIGEFG